MGSISDILFWIYFAYKWKADLAISAAISATALPTTTNTTVPPTTGTTTVSHETATTTVEPSTTTTTASPTTKTTNVPPSTTTTTYTDADQTPSEPPALMNQLVLEPQSDTGMDEAPSCKAEPAPMDADFSAQNYVTPADVCQIPVDEYETPQQQTLAQEPVAVSVHIEVAIPSSDEPRNVMSESFAFSEASVDLQQPNARLLFISEPSETVSEQQVVPSSDNLEVTEETIPQCQIHSSDALAQESIGEGVITSQPMCTSEQSTAEELFPAVQTAVWEMAAVNQPVSEIPDSFSSHEPEAGTPIDVENVENVSEETTESVEESYTLSQSDLTPVSEKSIPVDEPSMKSMSVPEMCFPEEQVPIFEPSENKCQSDSNTLPSEPRAAQSQQEVIPIEEPVLSSELITFSETPIVSERVVGAGEPVVFEESIESVTQVNFWEHVVEPADSNKQVEPCDTLKPVVDEESRIPIKNIDSSSEPDDATERSETVDQMEPIQQGEPVETSQTSSNVEEIVPMNMVDTEDSESM
eukprot:221790_1